MSIFKSRWASNISSSLMETFLANISFHSSCTGQRNSPQEAEYECPSCPSYWWPQLRRDTLLVLELPRLLSPDLYSNGSSLKATVCNHSHYRASEVSSSIRLNETSLPPDSQRLSQSYLESPLQAQEWTAPAWGLGLINARLQRSLLVCMY